MLLITVYTFALIFGSPHLAGASISEDFERLLEEYRIRMCHPLPKNKIPATDPFQIAHQAIYLDNSMFIDFSSSVTNFQVTGLSDFIVNSVQISTLRKKFDFNITFPMTNLTTDYTVKGSLAKYVRLDADDKLKVVVKEVNVVVSGGFKFGLILVVKNLAIDFKIGAIELDVGRFMPHDRLNHLIQNCVHDLGIELLNDFWNDYGNFITSVIESETNQRKLPLLEILEVIGRDDIFSDDIPGDCKDTLTYDH